MADNSARIAELEALLQSGVTSTSINGTTTTVDLSEIRRQLDILRRTDDTQAGNKPRMSSIRVGGLF